MGDSVPVTACTESDVRRALDQITADKHPVWSTLIEEHAVGKGLGVTPMGAGAQYAVVAVLRLGLDSMVDKHTAEVTSGALRRWCSAHWMSRARDCT